MSETKEDWIQVYFTDQPYQAEMLKKLLEGNGVESYVINKKDSSYMTFGEAELYIHEKDKPKAEPLIEEFKNS